MMARELVAGFEVLAEASDGVKRLRELVLQLAVRGRLVGQVAGEEPASKILAAIGKQKLTLRKADKAPAVQTGEAQSASLPEGWVSTTLGAVILGIEGGWSPAALARPKEGDEWGVLKVSACSWGEFLADENKALMPGTEPRLHAEVRAGDFLISRANTAELVGRSVVVDDCPPRLMLSDKTLRLLPADGVCVKYLNLANASPDARMHYSSEATGTSDSMRNVSQPCIMATPIALPPLAEQHRIVAKVAELMAFLDKLEAAKAARDATRTALRDAALARLQNADGPDDVELAWSRIAEQMDELFADPADVAPLRQAVLQLAVRGRLVRQEAGDEPAAKLLDQISKVQADLVGAGRMRKGTPPLPIPCEQQPFSIPGGWSLARVAALAGNVVDGTHHTPNYLNEGVPFLSAKDITERAISFGRCRFISQVEHDELSRRCRPRRGDVLVTKSGSIGRVAVVNTDVAFSLFESVALVPILGFVSPDFVALSLSVAIASETGQSQVKGAGVQHLHLKDLQALVLPIPPLAEQHRIVAKVDELMALLDNLEARLRSAKALQAAFAAAAVHHLDVAG